MITFLLIDKFNTQHNHLESVAQGNPITQASYAIKMRAIALGVYTNACTRTLLNLRYIYIVHKALLMFIKSFLLHGGVSR